MFPRRHPWFLLAALALLLAPFAVAVQPALAANTYTVDKLTDDPFVVGPTYCDAIAPADCSLRQALHLADHDSVASTVDFAPNLTGVITLDVNSYGPLTLTEGNTILQALLNPPAITQPPIEITNSVGSSDPAFTITSTGNTIRGLSITGFTGSGQPQGVAVRITGATATGNTVIGNYIGVKPDGTTVGANLYGVRIDTGASGNTISGNIIVGSINSGALIDNASGNTLISNLIGIGLSSTVIPNAVAGIEITSGVGGTSKNNTIGGTSAEANFISSNGPPGSNTAAGILIRGTGTTTNTVRSNLIGTDISGVADLGNNGDGIRIASGSSGNTIIGDNNSPVVISGNTGYGIRITGSPTSNNQIGGGVFIGLNRSRNATLPNDLGGLSIDQGASGTTVTGSSGALTLIGGNTGPGVLIKGSITAHNQITNAYIGAVPNPAVAGTITVANTGGGVLVQEGAQHSTISSSTISGNTGFGIRLSATKTVTVTGNYIGLNTVRQGTVANTGPGIDVQAGSTGTLIGAPGAGNRIAGNDDGAIKIVGTGTISTTVDNNLIGLVDDAAAGENYIVAAGNTGNGILVNTGAARITITNNRVASSSQAGISLSGVTTATLSLNNIGYVDNVNPPARPNTVGISLDGVTAVDVFTNTIRHNSGDAISATNVQTVTLRSNTVSDQSSGDAVEIGGDSSRVQVLSNTLTLNSGFGVLVGGTSQRVRIQYNSISKNTAGGVSLAGTTKGLVAETDVAALPNHGIDPPIYDPANDPTFTSPLRFTLDQAGIFAGYVYTDTNRVSSCRPVASCQIQFFQPESGVSDGQGFTPYKITSIGGGTPRDFASPDAEGFFTGRLVLPTGQNLPSQLIFAATDQDGNSSEFGVLNVTPSLKVNYLAPANGMQDATPGQTVTYTLQLVNDGTLKLSNVNVLTSGSLSGWTVNPPNGLRTPVTLSDHTSRTFTVTMTLPSGSHTNVRAGVQDRTSLFALVTGRIAPLNPSRIMTTTVLAAPVITASSLKNSGSAPPNGTVTHTHRFTNSGNITVTLSLAALTIDPANSGFIWNTVLDVLNSPNDSQMTIPPGQNATVDVKITVPPGAQVNAANGQPLIVTTVVTGTGQAPYTGIVRTASGTVGVDLVPSVQMGGNGQVIAAATLAEVSFNHSVTNTSNGPARFCLKSRSASGSTVLSYSSQNSIAIDSQGCFQLAQTTTSGEQSILRFKATVRVTGILLPQETDTLEIYLTDAATGQEIPNSTVVDTIEITVGQLLPRLWLPLVSR